PAAERVANKLLALIQSGNLKAGDKLPTENELAAALQVSRPVVREALRGLSIMGVVESQQGGRCYVTDLSPSRLLAPMQMVMSIDGSNVDALYVARSEVEGSLLRLGVPKVTADDLSKLQEMVKAGYLLASDPVGFRVLDLEFHQFLMGLAQNPFLERIAISLYELGLEYRRVASETHGVIERSAAEHEAIVAALATCEPEMAVRAMRNHLESIAKSTYDAMQRLGVAGNLAKAV
ncbi:MAG: FCD domain-containing protein, partial [Pseudomonadota bacterium]|nr:FCD domain-containing protein [Pseudomonadota bacterium]